MAAQMGGEALAEGPQPSARKGTPWSMEEHQAFLNGLQRCGRGNWRAISKNFVPSRSPTQVASHAQKYLLRVAGVTKRKSRFSSIESGQQNVDGGLPVATGSGSSGSGDPALQTISTPSSSEGGPAGPVPHDDAVGPSSCRAPSSAHPSGPELHRVQPHMAMHSPSVQAEQQQQPVQAPLDAPRPQQLEQQPKPQPQPKAAVGKRPLVPPMPPMMMPPFVPPMAFGFMPPPFMFPNPAMAVALGAAMAKQGVPYPGMPSAMAGPMPFPFMPFPPFGPHMMGGFPMPPGTAPSTDLAETTSACSDERSAGPTGSGQPRALRPIASPAMQPATSAPMQPQAKKQRSQPPPEQPQPHVAQAPVPALLLQQQQQHPFHQHHQHQHHAPSRLQKVQQQQFDQLCSADEESAALVLSSLSATIVGRMRAAA